jgi:hypothetical protein
MGAGQQENTASHRHRWEQDPGEAAGACVISPVVTIAPLASIAVDVVKQSVDTFRKDKQGISLATVFAKSKELDTEGSGKGISESAILDNQEARAYYEQHRSWRGSPRKRAEPLIVAFHASSGVIKICRDEQWVRVQAYNRDRRRIERVGTKIGIELPMTKAGFVKACQDMNDRNGFTYGYAIRKIMEPSSNGFYYLKFSILKKNGNHRVTTGVFHKNAIQQFDDFFTPNEPLIPLEDFYDRIDQQFYLIALKNE